MAVKNPYPYDCIEVNIATQTLRCFTGGMLSLETPCVTGTKEKNDDTPTGAFHIYQIRNDFYILERVFGKTKHVDHFFAFCREDDGVGIHDACWRESEPDYFTPDRYLNDGSLGCVHVPRDVSEKLSELIYLGMPVMVIDEGCNF